MNLIFQTVMDFMMSKGLFAATDLGLFEKLADRPLTLDELARDGCCTGLVYGEKGYNENASRGGGRVLPSTIIRTRPF